MSGGVIESAHNFGIQLRESADDGSDFSNAEADYRIVFLGEDGLLHLKDSAGTVTDIGGAAGSVATDAIWDAAGDTVYGTGANTGARLAIGTAGKVLTVNAGATAPEWATAAGSVVPWAIVGLPGAAPVIIRAATANRALYVPCTIPVACTILGVRLSIGTSSGNVCVGLYDAAGNRVATSGSVASPGTGAQGVAFTAGYAAAAGRYYLAFASDNATITIGFVESTASITSPIPALYQATAFPLPTSITSAGSASPPALIGLISGGLP